MGTHVRIKDFKIKKIENLKKINKYIEKKKEKRKEKTLMLGKIEGRRRRGQQRIRLLDVITNSTEMSLGRLWELVKDRKVWRAVVHGVTKSRTPLRD